MFLFVLFQPQFIHLSQLWSGFQDEMVLLSVLSNILASLDPFTRVSFYSVLCIVCLLTCQQIMIALCSHMSLKGKGIDKEEYTCIFSKFSLLLPKQHSI